MPIDVRRALTRRRLPSRAGAPTTSLVMPRGLHERATLAALRLNWSLAELIRRAVEEFLRRHADALREARP